MRADAGTGTGRARDTGGVVSVLPDAIDPVLKPADPVTTKLTL